VLLCEQSGIGFWLNKHLLLNFKCLLQLGHPSNPWLQEHSF